MSIKLTKAANLWLLTACTGDVLGLGLLTLQAEVTLETCIA